MQLTTKDVERFWRKVAKGKVDECWPWTASRTTAGYGQFGAQGKVFGVHRIAYFLYYAAWPEVARHSCDNPVCCNPRHIIDGTNNDNVQAGWRAPGFGSPPRTRSPGDGTSKQAALGELHPQAVISDAGVRHIRETYASGQVSQEELAVKFGVTQVWIGQVVRGERRAAAGGPIAKRGRGRRAWIEANPDHNLTAMLTTTS